MLSSVSNEFKFMMEDDLLYGSLPSGPFTRVFLLWLEVIKTVQLRSLGTLLINKTKY